MNVRSDDFGDDLPPIGGENSDPLPSGSQQPPVDRASADDNVDNMLDDIINQTGRQDGTPPAGQRTRSGEGTPPQDGSQQGRDPRRSQQPPSGQQGQGDGRAPNNGAPTQTPREIGAFFRTDAAGNIVDAQGRRVASSGAQRAVFDRVHRYYQGMETEHAAMRQRLQTVEQANEVARAAGLTIEEHAMGTRLMSAWKKDPVKTINFLLNQASESGTDVSSIRQGGGVDMAALGELVTARVKELLAPFDPVIQNIQRQREEEELRDATRQEMNTFFEQHPEARLHAPIIGKIMEQYEMNHREAYAELRVQAATHGWDLTKHLAPQAQETQQRIRGADPTGGGNRRLPPMTGRGSAGGNGTVRAGSRELAGPDTSYDDIINGVLEDVSRAQQ